MRLTARLVMLPIVALLLVGCSGSASGGSASGADAPAPPASEPLASEPPATTPGASTPGPAGGLRDQFGVRYCEVLTVRRTDTGTQAEVWGTQGLNDCPQTSFDAIDPAQVRDAMGVALAVKNGPRYWVLDDIVVHEIAGSRQVRDFGGIDMRSIATVELAGGLPDRRPYVAVPVKRDTEFRFGAGRTVHELTAPDGTAYVMQSYSVEVDPALTADALPGLAARLDLPEGWTFASRVLAEPLVVEDVDGFAPVLQDELRNSYQLVPGA